MPQGEFFSLSGILFMLPSIRRKLPVAGSVGIVFKRKFAILYKKGGCK